MRDLEAALLLGQLVRSDHALDPRTLAERFRHVGPELDRVAASRSAGRDALPVVRVAPERVEEELVISRVELDRRLPLVVDLAQVRVRVRVRVRIRFRNRVSVRVRVRRLGG